MFDYSKLRGRIKEKIGSESKFAEILGVSTTTLSYKFNGSSYFTAPEIFKTCQKEVLDINPELIGIYFFTPKLELNSRKN